MIDSKELEARMVLLRADGIGPSRTARLFDRFGSATAVLAAGDAEIAAVPGMSADLVRQIHKAREEKTLPVDLDLAVRKGLTLLGHVDKAYPEALKHIHASPALIWTTALPIPDVSACVAVVGTRRPSAAGKAAAYELAYALGSAGITVVSGLAYGIDSIAHRGALDAGAQTIAVLGSGLARVYPRRHQRLADTIHESGLLISEFPIRKQAQAGHFPRRNRIISGLSRAIVVVEAYDDGGALLTAKLALDQNRDVFAVPGLMSNPAAQGTNRLIENGEAHLVTGVGELVRSLSEHRDTVRSDAGEIQAHAHESSGPILDKDVATQSVSTEDRTLLSALESPIHIDDLSETLDRSIADVLIRLMQLECSGLVRQLPGKYFHRVVSSSIL